MSEKTLDLNIDELQKIAGYAHWIPVLRGFHEEFLQRNHPEWEWNQIVPELINQGFISENSKAVDQRYLAQGLSISRGIESVVIKVSDKRIKIIIKKSNWQVKSVR
jgi:hypothetical protein